MTFQPDLKAKRIITDVCNTVILVLSALLIVLISIDTFRDIPFLENHSYMEFQFWVCIVFLLDFFIELWLATDKWSYCKRRFLFFLLSIPYLNIVNYYDIQLTASELYWVRFIPLARGTLAISIVVGYLSTNKVSSLFGSYITILVASVYFGSLIFFNQEHGINPQITGYGPALWWACMDATTIGCDIQPVTVVGKIISAVLAAMGVMIFPLFTVYITTLVQRYNARINPTLSTIFGTPSANTSKSDTSSDDSN